MFIVNTQYNIKHYLIFLITLYPMTDNIPENELKCAFSCDFVPARDFSNEGVSTLNGLPFSSSYRRKVIPQITISIGFFPCRTFCGSVIGTTLSMFVTPSFRACL